MTGEDWKDSLMMLAGQARVVSYVDIPEMLRQIDHVDSVGAILDPTLYRAKVDAMHQDKELLEAALPLYRWAEKMKAIAEGKTQ